MVCNSGFDSWYVPSPPCLHPSTICIPFSLFIGPIGASPAASAQLAAETMDAKAPSSVLVDITYLLIVDGELEVHNLTPCFSH